MKQTTGKLLEVYLTKIKNYKKLLDVTSENINKQNCIEK